LVKPAGTLVKCSKCREIFKVYPPEPVDPRKYSRVKTRNLICYFSFDESENMTSQGLGIAMDISKGGILLETPCPIKPGLLVLSATDRDNNLMELRGKLVHSTQTPTGTYLCGVEFVAVDDRVRDFITRLIKEYSFRGSNLFIAVTRKATASQKAPIPLN
jgi:c-di-GMP-binding flagellar brake protein YcgR